MDIPADDGKTGMNRDGAGEKTVLVSGCFDLLHAGHVTFFKEASEYGRLTVSLGTDENIHRLKGKAPVFTQNERLFLVRSICFVHDAILGSGEGLLDFEPDLKRLKPDRFVVNSDGHTPEKENLCRENGVEYIVLDRVPEKGLPARSSSGVKLELRLPYRICLAGGWMDQPWVSKLHSGPVVVVQILPTIAFHERSGMATSSRKVALELWGDRIPAGDPERNARLLFGAENPPGSHYVSGSQDHLGLLLPGINRLHYDGAYWPARIDSITDPGTVRWLESILHLIPVGARPQQYDPLQDRRVTAEGVQMLVESAESCWSSIRERNVVRLGRSLTMNLEAWKRILPRAVPEEQEKKLQAYVRYPGAIFSGSGGGYIILASEEEVPDAVKIKIRI
jgi:cytidyltransferase-like protein